MAFSIIPTRVANVDTASAADFNALMANTQYNYDFKYFKTDFINITAGVADAGKPIKTDAAGVIDSSFYTDTNTHNQHNIANQALLNCNLREDQYTHVAKPYTLTGPNVYIADRWKVSYSSGSGATVDILVAAAYTETTETAATGRKGFRVTSLGGGTTFYIKQVLDTPILDYYKGYTCTASVWVNSTIGQVSLYIGGVISNIHGGAGWELLTVTLDGATLASGEYEIRGSTTGVSEVTDISGMSLNVGTSRIMPVDHHNELALCQRYYKKLHGLLHKGGFLYVADSAFFKFEYDEMRATPIASLSGTLAGTDFNISQQIGGSSGVWTFTASTGYTNQVLLQFGQVAHGYTALYIDIPATKYIELDAEI